MPNQTDLSIALNAVAAACRVCQTVQRRLVSPETLQKKDKSPVTVADFASQAVVGSFLCQGFPSDLLIAEEDSAELRSPEQAALLGIVTDQVSATLGRSLKSSDALEFIDFGNAAKSASKVPDRFWTLDPIDGTKGFLRAEQYAVALALIENGQVVLGVLGCPNLPMGAGAGALLFASRGRGAQSMPLSSNAAEAIRVSTLADTRQARFCESVESGHSDQDQSVKIAKTLGITSPGLRMDSQAKYAAVARGDAQIYLRLPTRADYREKIWDHAAGAIIVEEAGGKVTDIAGQPLDFALGHELKNNRGIIATNGAIHDAVVRAVQASS